MTDHVYQQLREQLAYLKLGMVAEQLAAALQQAETAKPSYPRLAEATLDVTTLAGDVDNAFDIWLRGQLRCAEAVHGGTVLVLRKLGEDVAADDANYAEISGRL
jgi:hypothetical protein